MNEICVHQYYGMSTMINPHPKVIRIFAFSMNAQPFPKEMFKGMRMLNQQKNIKRSQLLCYVM